MIAEARSVHGDAGMIRLKELMALSGTGASADDRDDPALERLLAPAVRD